MATSSGATRYNAPRDAHERGRGGPLCASSTSSPNSVAGGAWLAVASATCSCGSSSRRSLAAPAHERRSNQERDEDHS